MKKILSLVTALLLSAGISKAQNVYFAGHSLPDTLGNASAMVWKNNTLVYNWFDANAVPTINDMFVAENGDVYCAGHTIDTTNGTTGTVWKNGEVLFTAGEGSVFNKMIVNGEDIITAGYINEAYGQCHAAIWQNGELLYTPSDTFEYSAINAIATDDEGNIYSAGYVPYPSNTLIWKNDEVFLELNSVTDINDLIYSDGDVFSAGYVNANGFRIANIWQNDSLIYQEDSGSMFSEINSICKSGDDIFAAGYIDTTLIVLQNGEVLYEIPYTDFPIEGYSRIHQVCVTEANLYFTGCLNGGGIVWKDGEILYQPEDCSDIIGIAFVPECDGETRALPWAEGFEENETDWGCFSIFDFDGNAEIGWQRSDSLSLDGTFSARHLACDNIQEGWLITPPLYLQPNRDTTWMQFATYEAHPENFTYSGVWVSTTGTESSDFTEIWSQDNPSAEWDTVTLDLSAYQGEVLYLAFKYSGHHGHDWYIDQINMDEYYAQRDTISVFPYAENFENGMSDWYVLDLDHQGNQLNWRIENEGHDSEHSAFYPIDETGASDCWMISRPLHLDADYFYDLSFFHKDFASGDLGLGTLQIATDVEGLPTPDDFTPIWSNQTFDDDWTETGINLNEYAGRDIYLAFHSEGSATAWYVDDISIESRIAEYTITLTSNHPGWGNVSGGGTFHVHDTIQIAATAYMGFEFYEWSDGNTDNPRTIIVEHDMELQGMFRVQQCLIKTQVTPEGTGTVEGGGTYDYGTTIQLMARANPGCYFITWTDGIISNPRSVFVEGNATYTAEFGRNEYHITTASSPAEGGTVTGDGTYFYGDTARLVATPNTDYMFLCWSDGIASNPRLAKVTSDATYTALFHMTGTPNYTITVSPNDSNLGTVTGSGLYPEGSVIQITAIPFSGCRFIGWNDGNFDNPRDVEVTANLSFIANFEACPIYTITVESEDILMGTVHGGGNFAEGTSTIISATANEGFYFSGWQDGDMNNPRLINVVEDATYIASFSLTPTPTYTITVYYDESQGFVIGAGTYAEGATASLAAIANDGFLFTKWSDDTTDNPKEIVVDHDIILAAFFNTNGVDDIDLTHFALFPNPATHALHIEGIEGEAEINIYNALGCLVKTGQICGDSEIGIDELSAGLYLLKIGNRCVRFVKE